LSASDAVGVGQPDCGEVEALADVWRAEARSAEIERCEGVTRSFHVSVYRVEPSEAVRARNLLSKNDRRAALLDELEPVGPEVARVVESAFSTGSAEGLARATTGPNGSVI
jgi:hypothetical protein